MTAFSRGASRKLEILKALKVVEEKVEKGEDAKRDFRRIVGELKRGENVDEEVLRRVAELRDKFFKKQIVLDYTKGVVVFVLFFIISNATFFFLVLGEIPLLPKLIALFLIEFSVLYFSFLTGRITGAKISGIRVEGFYKYNPLEFGMKLDYASYLKVPQKSRVILFLTPILFENLVMLTHAITLFFLKNEFYWIPMTFLIANLPLSYTIYKIKRTGELYRLIREIRIFLSEKSSA